ncbi:hypothetical protein KEJ14_03535 [Candidatus Bathyarchaeota archaeon]|nr:hypothetical protein [Candidatus Bathyarchaeota archaeon]
MIKESGISAPTILYAISISYFVVGTILLAIMALSKHNLLPLHLGFVGALNIVASYSLIKARRWTLHVVVFVSLVNLTFSFTALIAIVNLFGLRDILSILFLLGISAYVILSATSLGYVIRERSKFR